MPHHKCGVNKIDLFFKRNYVIQSQNKKNFLKVCTEYFLFDFIFKNPNLLRRNNFKVELANSIADELFKLVQCFVGDLPQPILIFFLKKPC